MAADVQQSPVLHARGAGGFAGAAGEAAVEMQLCLCGSRISFKYLFYKINSSAWTIELIAQQLIGRASRSAETAVHAFAQDGVGFLALGRVPDEISELGLH
jgi:hypothetical protein